jgi:hypothetical protein
VHLPDGHWVRDAAPVPPLWLVYAARSADPVVTRARAQELERLQIAVQPLESPSDLAGALVLSRHATREAAEAALAALPLAKPLRYLRVVSLPAPPAVLWLRVPKADPEQQARLRALPAELLAGGFKTCKPRAG